MLLDDIKTDSVKAQKARDDFRLSVLRYVLSEIKYKELALRSTGEVLTQDHIVQVLKKLVKQRSQSIEGYLKANKPELAKKEEAEQALVQAYLDKVNG